MISVYLLLDCLAGLPLLSVFVNKSERVPSEVILAKTERAGSRGHDHRHSLPNRLERYFVLISQRPYLLAPVQWICMYSFIA